MNIKNRYGGYSWFVIALLACQAWMIHPALGIALCNAPAVLTPEEFRTGLKEIKDGIEKSRTDANKEIADLKAALKTQEDERKKLVDKLEEQQKTFDGLRKQFISRGSIGGQVRRPGMVTDQCARELAARFIVGNAKSGRLDLIDTHVREALFNEARNILGLEAKAALTTTDVPLPIEYSGEVRELISDFGVARREMMHFPIGRGTAKPPRFKTRPTFGSIAMSAALAEKSPQIEFASLESHKIGGIVRVPREIDEQSIVPMGQFLAKYGAVEFARAEDTWAFLADGTATYESVKGITKIALDNSKLVTLGAGELAPSDVLIDDFRAMRGLVNAAALGQGAKYYLHSTWERQLRTFNTAADPYIFVPNAVSNRLAIPGPTLDGFPIVWTDVLLPFSTTDLASSYLAVFGLLGWWWFGEHGSPRTDFSSDVYFGTDELATRFIEEIDFDYQQVDVTSALRAAAA